VGAASALILGGSEAQKKAWLPKIAEGTAIAALAIDEGPKYAPEKIALAATKKGSGYSLSGSKTFVMEGMAANVFVVAARTSGKAGDEKGISLFLVPLDLPGITVGRLDSLADEDFADVHLDVEVPASAVVGPVGGAGPLIESLLRRAAVGASAEMLGAARRCLDKSVEYAKVREQFGQLIGSFQAIRHRCADMLLAVEKCHSAVYYAAWALDAGAEDAALAASVCKAFVSEAARDVCGDAIQVHGGIGFTWEYDLHLYFKRAKALEPMYGDAAYHRELVVRAVAS
jgi:alkylation response protein AidB-like acyl-CoA dehydrogenase